MNLLRPNERALTVDGRRLHLLDWGGDARPPLLLLHGFTGHAHAWDTLAIALQPHFHVMALDARGHGDSDPADVYDAAGSFRDLSGVVEPARARGWPARLEVASVDQGAPCDGRRRLVGDHPRDQGAAAAAARRREHGARCRCGPAHGPRAAARHARRDPARGPHAARGQPRSGPRRAARIPEILTTARRP